MANLSAEQIGYLVNHLFLPPQLPAATNDSFERDSVLLGFVVQALKDFSPWIPQDQRETMQHVASGLSQFDQMRDEEGVIDEKNLLDNLKNLKNAAQGKSWFPPSHRPSAAHADNCQARYLHFTFSLRMQVSSSASALAPSRSRHLRSHHVLQQSPQPLDAFVAAFRAHPCA